jgi:hypothetical protein
MSNHQSVKFIIFNIIGEGLRKGEDIRHIKEGGRY